MKKIMFVVALALVVSSCAAPEPGVSNNANLAANINAATPASSPAPSVSDADIIAKENAAWDAAKAKDASAMSALLADDFVYVTNEGVQDKATLIKNLQGPGGPTDATLSNFKVLKLDKDAAVIAYDVVWKGGAQGQPPRTVNLHASSAWLNRGGKWLASYHQDCEAKAAPTGQPTPGSSPSAKPAATAVASPSASPAATTAATAATDMEKQVWDALKAKNWDAFAAFLADDQLEVEPNGVHDKAGSVNGVKQFDFKGTTLSDFKEVKLDADATLVTYTVHGPSPDFTREGERHSTIWVNRSGHSLAVFHHGGTTITGPQK